MKVVLQRVAHAVVTVGGQAVAEIGPGLLLLVGAGPHDGDDQISYLVDKIANLRIFEDEAGKMNRSVLDVEGEALVVSQFTLYADTRRGRRPSFTGAAPPDLAQPLIERFAAALTAAGVPTRTGRFGAHMQVNLTNDGPVTILLER